ncbi:Mss4p nuclear export [Physocladia obscura]|uniref:Protein BCP1 n=1 Tax=Physocladia obscura TaxID=109957 RepID=A0AAD5T0M7_9FUNG|nr:Mss4p nuclear export [Physocladia obscura]
MKRKHEKREDEEEEVDGNESDGSSDTSDSNSDDSKEEIIDVDFDFFDPKEIDFHGLKTLLKQTVSNDHELFNLSALADRIIAQPHLGSVVKVDNSDDPYAVMTIISIIPDAQTKKLPQEIATIKDYILQKSSKSSKYHDRLESLLSSKKCGLLINERLINLPPQIVVPMLKMLDAELVESVTQKKSANFEYFLVISKTYTECDPLILDEDDGNSSNALKKRKTKKSVNGAAGKQVILNFQVEDEIFEKFDEFHFDYKFSNQNDQSELMQTAGIKTSRRLYVIERSKLPQIQQAMDQLLN